MIGHSMGSLMLQSGLLALLKEGQLPARPAQACTVGAVRLESGKDLVWFPDLILALNSAAHSSIARRIVDALAKCQLAPPIMMSVTSTADTDTRHIWRLAQGIFAPWRKTDGHDASLFTHDFVLTECPD